MIEQVLTEKLTNQDYDADKAGELSEELVRSLRDAAKRKPDPTNPRNADVPLQTAFPGDSGRVQGAGTEDNIKELMGRGV
jgi:hypothetical protein